MGEAILKTNLKREQGYLYYVSSDKDKNLILNKAKMCRGGQKKKKKN